MTTSFDLHDVSKTGGVAGDENLFSQVNSLVQLLELRAAAHPEKIAYAFLKDGENVQSEISFAELHSRAKILAGHLVRLGAKNTPVLILYPSGVEYIVAFLGCLYARAIAVPLYPPRDNLNLKRVLTVIDDANPSVLLSNAEVYGRVSGHTGFESNFINQIEGLGVKWVLTDKDDLGENEFIDCSMRRDELAYLQYTSGSTSTPKGVMISHGNVLHNQSVIRSCVAHSFSTRIVTWLPIFHDMGLVGTILPTIYSGATCYLMQPADFLRKPLRWLKAISEYKATYSGAPNFAFDLCVKRINEEQAASLDLSSLTHLFNGAEPIKAKTLTDFTKKFSVSGFNAGNFFPAYGMAETTLVVTGELVSKNIQTSVDVPDLDIDSIERDESSGFVSCGKTWLDDTLIKIVDASTLTECSEGEVGEIWVNSLSVAMGYWNNEEATREVFDAKIIGSKDERLYFRTGDLGYTRNKRFYITGRLKDIIIIRGKNYYPQDIERLVQSFIPCVADNTATAFYVLEGEEKLVLVAEVNRVDRASVNFDEVVEKCKELILREFGLTLFALVLIRPNTTLKTTSGKLQRYSTKEAYIKDDLKILYHWNQKLGFIEDNAAQKNNLIKFEKTESVRC